MPWRAVKQIPLWDLDQPMDVLLARYPRHFVFDESPISAALGQSPLIRQPNALIREAAPAGILAAFGGKRFSGS